MIDDIKKATSRPNRFKGKLNESVLEMTQARLDQLKQDDLEEEASFDDISAEKLLRFVETQKLQKRPDIFLNDGLLKAAWINADDTQSLSLVFKPDNQIRYVVLLGACESHTGQCALSKFLTLIDPLGVWHLLKD